MLIFHGTIGPEPFRASHVCKIKLDIRELRTVNEEECTNEICAETGFAPGYCVPLNPARSRFSYPVVVINVVRKLHSVLVAVCLCCRRYSYRTSRKVDPVIKARARARANVDRVLLKCFVPNDAGFVQRARARNLSNLANFNAP